MNINLDEIELNYIADLISLQKENKISADDIELCNDILDKIYRLINNSRIRMSERDITKLLNKKI